MAPYCRVVDSLLKGALKVRNALGTTPKSHLFAEIVAPFPADGTLTAWNADFEGNPVTNGEASDLRPDSHDYTGGFMSKGQGRTSTQVAIGELVVIAYIRAADTG